MSQSKQFLQVKYFTGKKMNSIVRVGDGDRLYREQSQWNLSGDRRVSVVLRD